MVLPLICCAVEISYDSDNDNSESYVEEIKDIDIANDSNGVWHVEYANPDNWIIVMEDNIANVELPHIEPIPYEPRRRKAQC